MRRLGVFVLFALFTTVALALPARAQNDKIIEDPDVIIEGAGRSPRCDDLLHR